MEHRLASILAADMVGYSRLMEADAVRTLIARGQRRDHPRTLVGRSEPGKRIGKMRRRLS
jgi:hypothetical protein